MKTLRRDWISGIILFVFAVIYFFFADNLPHSKLSDEIGADGYPKLLAVSLAVFSLLIIISGILKRVPDSNPDEGKYLSKKDLYSFKRAGGALLIAVIYLLFLTVLGYFLSVVYLFSSVVIYNGGKFSKKLIIMSFCAAVFFWIFFVFLLDVPMPSGIWGKLIS